MVQRPYIIYYSDHQKMFTGYAKCGITDSSLKKKKKQYLKDKRKGNKFELKTTHCEDPTNSYKSSLKSAHNEKRPNFKKKKNLLISFWKNSTISSFDNVCKISILRRKLIECGFILLFTQLPLPTSTLPE